MPILNSEKLCVAYLDILGFREFIHEDIIGASTLLEHYQNVLDEICTKSPIFPEEESSIKYFIPYSDSIFIASPDNVSFVQELSKFIYRSFVISSYPFEKKMNPIEPFDVYENHHAKWFPLLFRGGIGFGKCNISYPLLLSEKERHITTLLIGDAVIEAVRYEELKIKGPRIICGKNFYDSFEEEYRNKFLYNLNDNLNSELYELYWPIFLFLNSVQDPKHVFEYTISKLLVSAIHLWQSLNHKKFSLHYYNFIKLIVRSVIRYCDNIGSPTLLDEELQKTLIKENMESKIDDLFNDNTS